MKLKKPSLKKSKPTKKPLEVQPRLLSEEEIGDIGSKIDYEGFDYYFCDYGGLSEFLGTGLEPYARAYIESKRKLIEALNNAGFNLSETVTEDDLTT